MDGYDAASIGRRVAAYRRIAGMTAEQLAEAVGGGMTRTAIAKLENGYRVEVSTELLMHLSWALQVPPMVLLLPLEDPRADITLPTVSGSTESLAYWIDGLPLSGVDLNGAAEVGNAVLAEFRRHAASSVDFLNDMTLLVEAQTRALPDHARRMLEEHSESRALSRQRAAIALASLRKRLGLDG